MGPTMAWFGLGVCALGVAAAIAWVGTPEPPSTGADSQPATPRPTPEQALAEHRREMEAELESYGWVDREQRIVRVPIEEGMARVLRMGLPARDAPSPAEEPAEEQE